LITEAAICDALDKVASLVALDESYLPIYQRLEQELEDHTSKNSALHRAKARASQNANGLKSFAA